MELTKEQLRALLKRWFALYGGSTSEDRFSQAEMTALDRDTDLALRGLGGTTQEPVASTQKLACYGIVNNAGEMFMDEMCVSSDRHSLEELVERMRSDDPDNDWRVAPMFFGAPAGTVAVPREPTEAMWDAAWKSIGLPYRAKLSMHEIRTLFEKFHAAMLSAAPAAPEAGSEQVAVTEEGRIPDVLLDGYRVYSALGEHEKKRTSADNVSDTLDAVVRLMRHDMNKERQP